MKKTRQSALIIFARYPREGEVKTRLGAEVGMARATEVYKRLAEHAFGVGSEVATAGIRVWLFYEPSATEGEMKTWVGCPFEYYRQDGSDLGMRMHNAFRRTFEAGALRTIIVGSDIPELHVELVHEAFERLDRDQVVIGPAEDSGYYLLGMNKGVGDCFTGIAWSTPRVLPETLARFRELKLRYSVLRTLADIDTNADLLRFAGWFAKP